MPATPATLAPIRCFRCRKMLGEYAPPLLTRIEIICKGCKARNILRPESV